MLNIVIIIKSLFCLEGKETCFVLSFLLVTMNVTISSPPSTSVQPASYRWCPCGWPLFLPKYGVHIIHWENRCAVLRPRFGDRLINCRIMPGKGQQFNKMDNHWTLLRQMPWPPPFTSRDVVNMPKAALGVSFQNLQEQVLREILQIL